MSSSLKERLGRLGPTRVIDRVRNGSPAVLSLRPAADRKRVKTVSVALALGKRGMTMLRAKRAVEEMIERGRAVFLLPNLDSESALAEELADAGCVAASVATHEVDVRALRERLGLTQEQFALRYGLDLDAVRNWEHKRRTPDLAAQSYLRVIERMPEKASEAQEEVMAPPLAGAP
jgi:DNA-binding transcriptional regulator YiaG